MCAVLMLFLCHFRNEHNPDFKRKLVAPSVTEDSDKVLNFRVYDVDDAEAIKEDDLLGEARITVRELIAAPVPVKLTMTKKGKAVKDATFLLTPELPPKPAPTPAPEAEPTPEPNPEDSEPKPAEPEPEPKSESEQAAEPAPEVNGVVTPITLTVGCR
jgi:outer membrane biosynthesis protein TonB